MASRNYVIISSSSSSSGRTCLCSPTSHPGSFRCSFHRSSGSPTRIPYPKPPQMNRSVAKVGMVKALILIKLIKPSSHDLHRRRNFQPKPTRFCNVHHINSNQLMVA
ncbi:hypothetical protein C2S53_009137 [Perilla frutescens var. hirtella]|uniref:Uncharacterized protein n=1 Tax=Perilla frutescens var. hirtella TaxID=608512 RepID=A0AAD4PA93_PERFH|nr:hypothetical protein C2S53_009137 [Perilla frutescens var. hirtella]